jgi:4-hydroxy-4-methyl-2-oxoglutarate aldolase
MKIECERLVEQFQAFDPATIYEAAGHRGMVDPAIRPAWPGARLCGIAATVQCPPCDNLMLHHAVAAAQPGVVIVADIGSYLLAGAWGEVLTVAAQAKGIAGLAVNGAVRDISAIASRGFAVFSRGLAIGACTKERFGALRIPIQFGGVAVRPGDIIIGDADGLVVVEQEHAKEVYLAAAARQQRETEIMGELQNGRTTVELLNLPGFPHSGVAAK